MKRKKVKTKFPPGWNERRVRAVIKYYDNQTDDQAIAEDEARISLRAATTMRIPASLVAQVRALIARQQQKRRSA